MPNYKMVDADVLDGAMLETAKAIREKGGTEELIPWNKSTGYKEAIEAIKGGGGLNFEVVGGTVQPENPKENTIWLETGVNIPMWRFSSDEPASAEEGMVLITIGTSSDISFNASDSEYGILMVYPIDAKQYVSGSWEFVPAKTYMNGEWVAWWDGELFENGDQFEFVTGGWWQNTAIPYRSGSLPNTGTVSIGETITLNAPSGKSACVWTKNKIDLSRYNTLSVTVEADFGSTHNLAIMRESAGNIEGSAIAYRYLYAGENRLDISSDTFNGEFYIVISVANNRSGTVTNVHLEV